MRLAGGALGVAAGFGLTVSTPTDAQLHQDGGVSRLPDGNLDTPKFSRSDALGASIGGGFLAGIIGFPVAITMGDTPGVSLMSFGAGAIVGGILGGLTASVLDSRSAVKQLNY